MCRCSPLRNRHFLEISGGKTPTLSIILTDGPQRRRRPGMRWLDKKYPCRNLEADRPRPLPDRFACGDLDAEAREAHIMVIGRGQQADRGNAEVFQDLRTEANFAPLMLARRL
jgi:hypothetical protein